MDRSQNYLSEQVIQLGDAVDFFFSNERVLKGRSQSNAQVTLGLRYPYNDRPIPIADFRMYLQLPHTSKRFNLIVENVSESIAEGRRPNSQQSFDLTRSSDSNSSTEGIGAALRYFIIETDRWSLHTDAGIKMVFPPDSFLKMKAEHKPISSGRWLIRPRAALYWFGETGLGHRETIEFDRRLARRWLYRQANNITWESEDTVTNYFHSHIFFNRLTRRDWLSYNIELIAHNKPVFETKAYAFTITHRRRLYQKWLYSNLIPRINWPKTSNFRAEPEISISLESKFGSF